MSSYFSIFLEESCNLLDSYKGRDKILRTLCYTTKLIGGLHHDEELAKKLARFSSIMSATRTTLRLFDDLPMLKYNLEYGFGKEESDRLMSSLGVTTNIIDQIYYPIEKIAWLAEHKLITSVNKDRWDLICTIFWVVSIYLSLMKTVRYISLLQIRKNCAILERDETLTFEKLLTRQHFEILTAARLSLDFIQAVNYLPDGFLWSSKLKTWHVGLVASISSVLGLYQVFAKRKLA